MTPYILLIFVPGILCFFSINNEKKKLCIGINEYNRKHNLCIPAFFTVLFVVLAIRDKTIGRDLPNYFFYWNRYRGLGIDELLRLDNDIDTEYLYRLLNNAVGWFTDDFQWFLVIVSVFEIVPLMYLYKQDRRHSYLKIVLFLNMSTFILLFSGLRQSLAISLGVMAYFCVRKKRFFSYVFCVTLAFLMHHSAFMLLMLYPLYWIRFKRMHLWIVIPLFAIVFAFRGWVFAVLSSLLSGYNYKYTATAGNTNAFASLILFIMLTAVCFILPEEKRLDKETIGLRNLIVFATALQIFASLNPHAMRLNYYYITFIPVAVTNAVTNARHKYKQTANLVSIVLSLFFTLYFIYGVYNSYTTGISALDTIPYKAFWETSVQ